MAEFAAFVHSINGPESPMGETFSGRKVEPTDAGADLWLLFT